MKEIDYLNRLNQYSNATISISLATEIAALNDAICSRMYFVHAHSRFTLLVTVQYSPLKPTASVLLLPGCVCSLKREWTQLQRTIELTADLSTTFHENISQFGIWENEDCKTNTRGGVNYFHVAADKYHEHCIAMHNPHVAGDLAYQKLVAEYDNAFLDGLFCSNIVAM